MHIPDGILAPVKPGEPANYLLIGSDVRPADETPAEKRRPTASTDDVGRARSDVMMVLHVDPAVAHRACWCRSPATWSSRSPVTARNLLNAAFAFGGPPLVIQTLADRLQAAADQPLPRGRLPRLQEHRRTRSGTSNLYFPTPVHDPYTGLDVEHKRAA